jgi:hypothetical protein
MTVSTTQNRVSYAGNGVTSAFSFPYVFFDNADLVVLKVQADGTSTKGVLGTDYTVTGAGADAGGTITMTVPPTAGTSLVIYRDPALTQSQAFVDNDPLPAKSIARGYDRQTLISQRLRELVDRSFRLSDADTSGVSPLMPSPTPNAFIGWNGLGNALVSRTVTDLVTISAYGTAVPDKFIGDGSKKDFTLTSNPGAMANMDVSISGITQMPDLDFTWDGGTKLSFTTAPPAPSTPGTPNVYVRYLRALPQGYSDAAVVNWLDNGGTPRDVQSTLQRITAEWVSVKDPRFGAKGDGSSCVTAVRAALAYLQSKGGGTLHFPDGVYLLDDVTLIGDPSPTASQYRYWFQAVSNVTIVGGRGAVLKVANGVVAGDAAKQFCKGYQIFWAWSIATVENFTVRGLTIDCNGANNLAPAKNSYGSGVQTHVLVSNCAKKWRFEDVHVLSTSGYQCVAFYLGSTDVEVLGNHFYDMASSIAGNTSLTDHSTIYIECDTYRVDGNRFINTNYGTVETCIETHGYNGLVVSNYGRRYNLGMLRAAMLGDSYNVTNANNVFDDVTIGAQFDARPGRRLEALLANNQFRLREYAQVGTRTPSAINTAGGFVGRTSANYADIRFIGNSFSAPASITAAGVKSIIGGNVDFLTLKNNRHVGFSKYFEAGNFVDGSTVVVDGDYIEGASGALFTHASYVAGDAASNVDYRISNLDLTKSPSATYFLQCSYDNAHIRNVSISGDYAIAIQPYTGFWSTINNSFFVNYSTASVGSKLCPPFVTGRIYDRSHNALFQRDNIGEAQRWRITRWGTAAPTTSFAVGDDHPGDVVLNITPVAGGPKEWGCVNPSSGAGVLGTWAASGIMGEKKIAFNGNSTATDVTTLKNDHNQLLQTLRDAGLMS